MAVVLLWRWTWRKFPRLLNRETVSYVVFGVLTTLVNMAVYGLSYNTLGIHNLISNAIAWTAAVLFAYAVNKLFVFHSHVRGAGRSCGSSACSSAPGCSPSLWTSCAWACW